MGSADNWEGVGGACEKDIIAIKIKILAKKQNSEIHNITLKNIDVRG